MYNPNLLFSGSIAKADHSLSTCEDYFGFNLAWRRFAVADGTSQQLLSALFAKLLVEQFTESHTALNRDFFKAKNWLEWLTPIREKWLDAASRHVRKVEGMAGLTLRNRLNLREPAASTFVGIEFKTEGPEIRWEAMLIGDSCLFQIRDEVLFASWLIQRSSDFNDRPQCFASLADTRHEFEPTFISETAQPNDVLVLATDALAAWLLAKNEAGCWQETWSALRELDSQASFKSFIHRARMDQVSPLRDDDMTLCMIHLAIGAPRTKAAPPQEKLPEVFEPSPVRAELITSAAVPPPELTELAQVAQPVVVASPVRSKLQRSTVLVGIILLASVCLNVLLLAAQRQRAGPAAGSPTQLAVSQVAEKQNGENSQTTGSRTLPVAATRPLPSPLPIRASITPSRRLATPTVANPPTIVSPALTMVGATSPATTATPKVFSLVLERGSQVFAEPSTASPPIFVIRQSQGTYLGVGEPITGQGITWQRVQFDVWSISVLRNFRYTQVRGEQVVILANVNARTVPNPNNAESLVGQAVPPGQFAKLDEKLSNGRTWYQYRVTGYVVVK